MNDKVGIALTIKKVSNYGTKHPVVARLNVQTAELLDWADINKDQKDTVFDIYDRMKNRLLKCHEAFGRLSDSLKETIADEQYSSDSKMKNVPHVVALESEVETILYEQKNFLRDLLDVMDTFFGIKLTEASAFYDAKNGEDGKLVKWATEAFGSNDPFTEMLRYEQQWIEEVIRKRNAVEHPGGRSGTLHIHNFVQTSDGKFEIPSWHRDDMPRTSIFSDIEVLLDNLLTLAEDVLVSCIVHKGRLGEMFSFGEISEAKRDVNCPKRIQVVPASACR